MDDRAVNTNGNGNALMGFEQFGSNMMWGHWSVSLLGKGLPQAALALAPLDAANNKVGTFRQ